jgi:putative sterol carrier protein
MALPFPSAAWASAYKDAINQNALYRQAAASWDQGAVALVCKPEPALGLAEPQAVVLDLKHGECRGVTFTTDEFEIDDAPFVIEASYAQWKAILKRELDPILAMLASQLRLKKGHLPTLIKDVEGSKQLVLSASQVDTAFLD